MYQLIYNIFWTITPIIVLAWIYYDIWETFRMPETSGSIHLIVSVNWFILAILQITFVLACLEIYKLVWSAGFNV